MAVETEHQWAGPRDRGKTKSDAMPRARVPKALAAIWRTICDVSRFFRRIAFSSLTRRIAILNLAGLAALVSAILYLNQFREGLIDARVQSLMTQGEIIAEAIAEQATTEINAIRIDPERLLELQAGEFLNPTSRELGLFDFTINPEKVAPILRRLISPTRTRARIYDRDGIMVVDSSSLYSRGQILRFDLPPPSEIGGSWLDRIWMTVGNWLRRRDLPLYEELGPREGRGYPEVSQALDGVKASIVRVNEAGEVIVSVAVPIQRFRTVLGAMLLSTQGGDIDSIVHAERMAILRVFIVAAAVMLVLSILLAGTIAGPVHKLAAAAERVRRGTRSRERIPDFSSRNDEIGHLARTLREMTDALYWRIDATGQFAADVAHELKNPLTSLRSAVETLPLAKKEGDRDRLIAVIEHDVRRLDRLITDISDASRLDAELVRADAEPVNIASLLDAVTAIGNELGAQDGVSVSLATEGHHRDVYFVEGHDIRLGQVFTNLIDNARSFSSDGDTVRIGLRRVGPTIEVTVDDDGPGIPPDNLERIFERFYTDRAEQSGFGQSSGLGLSISRQIVEAHRGRIWAENRHATPYGAAERADQDIEPEILGARFVVRLPALG